MSTCLPSFPFGSLRLEKRFTVDILHCEHMNILKSEKFTFTFHPGLYLAMLAARDFMAWPFLFLVFQPFVKLSYIIHIKSVLM